jgi:hypothetical protein
MLPSRDSRFENSTTAKLYALLEINAQTTEYIGLHVSNDCGCDNRD